MAQELAHEEEIVDPTSEMQKQSIVGQLVDRPATLDNATIALYSNNKQNSDHFIRGVAEEIQDQYPSAEIRDVVYKNRASEPGSRWGLIEQIAEDADVALVAYGDCGSCALYTVYDAIELEQAGVATVSYCSSKFIKLGRYDALNFEVPGLPIVEFEHPIADFDPDEVKANRVTDKIVEDTVFALTSSGVEIEEEFASRYSIEEYSGRPQFDQCTI